MKSVADYTLRQQNLVDGSWGGWFKQDEFAGNSLVGGVHQSVL